MPRQNSRIRSENRNTNDAISSHSRCWAGKAGGNAGCIEYRKTVLERAKSVDEDKLAGAILVGDAIGSIFETLEALDILNSTLIFDHSNTAWIPRDRYLRGEAGLSNLSMIPIK